ncbi:ABC transporter permease [Clostridium sp. MSJ-4]|uniref:ABC transporter permease n=1 Tax=Clostridium simiarum TaxID=2841506 RepID=A0ABS6EX05_9CLOT|nr:FtsX-like permease family protein [Clostridium simiarum]MBU5590184.1 ABC transporter permease [Clostridium simiarum]
MIFKDVLKMAFRDLGRRKGRTFLTSLAVAIGSMLIVTMVGLGTTAEGFILKQLNKEVSAKLIEVAPQKYMSKEELEKLYSGDMTDEEREEAQQKAFKKIDESTINNMEKIDGVDFVRASIESPISNLKLEGKETGKKHIQVAGYNDNNNIYTKDEIEAMKNKKDNKDLEVIIAGRNLTDKDENGILINENLLKHMGITDYNSVIGKEAILIQDKVENENVKVKPLEVKVQIVGVVNEAFDKKYVSSVITSLKTATNIKSYYTLTKDYLSEKGYGSIQVYAKDQGKVKEIDEAIKNMGYAFMSNEEIAKQIKSAFIVVEQILSVLGVIVLFVAALGTINTMTMAIHERTKSIGIMKSVGATRKDIHNIFLTQAAVIGFIGGVMGIIFSFINGAIIEFALKMFLEGKGVNETISFSMPVWLVGGALVFAIILSVLSGIYPARKASSLDAIEALNS